MELNINKDEAQLINCITAQYATSDCLARS